MKEKTTVLKENIYKIFSSVMDKVK